SRLSVSNCRIRRPRPAPNATRTANSFRRETARESSAPARLAQVMSSTSAALALLRHARLQPADETKAVRAAHGNRIAHVERHAKRLKEIGRSLGRHEI